MQQLGFFEAILDTIFNGVLGGLANFIVGTITTLLEGFLPFTLS